MKKVLRTFAGIVCLVSIVLAGAETPDGGVYLPWTLGFMASAVLSAFILKRLGYERGRRG